LSLTGSKQLVLSATYCLGAGSWERGAGCRGQGKSANGPTPHIKSKISNPKWLILLCHLQQFSSKIASTQKILKEFLESK
jgi:hypothetical protein